MKADEDETTDALFVEIGGLRVVNIYIPPIRAGGGDTRTQLFSPNPWPRDRNVIICGDVNGHSLTWDPHTEEDEIGKEIDEWGNNE